MSPIGPQVPSKASIPNVSYCFPAPALCLLTQLLSLTPHKCRQNIFAAAAVPSLFLEHKRKPLAQILMSPGSSIKGK